MLACILKTNPLNLSSSGCTVRVSVSRGCGAGACSEKASNSGSTPKLLIAEPKNTGVISPFK